MDVCWPTATRAWSTRSTRSSQQHRRRGPIALTFVRRDEFTAPRDGYFASVRFERDGEGRVTAFVVNGDPRSRDVRFVRR